MNQEKANFFRTIQILSSNLGTSLTAMFLALMPPQTDLKERTNIAIKNMKPPAERFLPRQKQVSTPRKIIGK